MEQRGVILAGGQGTRLGELTRATNKHLLPVGAEPMVYHPLRKLIGAGVRDILLISGAEHLGDFSRQLGSGRHLGCALTYRAQEAPGGIAQALGLAGAFCANAPLIMLLGDNIFYDPLSVLLKRALGTPSNAVVALKQVSDPTGFGVAELGAGRIVGLEEKPARPRSDLAVAGIYAYPPDVFAFIKELKPSARGELEITDLNRMYLERKRLDHVVLEGYWTDAGTPESYALANNLVREQGVVFE